MLDTNTASYLIRNRNAGANARADKYSDRVCISVIAEAEIRFGMAKRSLGVRKTNSIQDFLAATPILAWDSAAAAVYAVLRKQMEAEGLNLSDLDMLIAAHALAVNAVLVTSDKAFYKASHLLRLENWIDA